MRPGALVPCVLALLLAGCQGLLPRGASDTTSAFRNFEDAQAAAQRIEPFRTRTPELAALGFDPYAQNVTLIPYPEIVARLIPYSGVPIDRLEPGIQACIHAQSDCRAFLYRFQREDRKRDGVFLLDFFNIQRKTVVTGWWFEALVVVRRDEVLFRSVAGQRRAERLDKQTNPLGPLQPAGEWTGPMLLK